MGEYTKRDKNRDLHSKEAEVFDLIHPELYSKRELSLINAVIAKIGTERDFSSLKVLDVASGTGRLSIPFIREGALLYGCDISLDMLDSFKRKVKRLLPGGAKVFFINLPIGEFLEDNNGKFDIIVMGAFLHHVTDPMKFIFDIADRVEDGGYIFILRDPPQRRKSILLNRIFEKADSFLFQVKYFIKHRHLMPRFKSYGDVDIHTRYGIDDDAIVKILRRRGFDIVFHKKYYSHKTAIMTFLDEKFFRILPQFSVFAKKKPNKEKRAL